MKTEVAIRKKKDAKGMKRISFYKPSCPLCGRRKNHIHSLADTLQNVSSFLINLLKVGILLLFLTLIGAALIK